MFSAEWVNPRLCSAHDFALQLGQNKGARLCSSTPKSFLPKPDVTAKQVLFTNASGQTLEAIGKLWNEQKKEER